MTSLPTIKDYYKQHDLKISCYECNRNAVVDCDLNYLSLRQPIFSLIVLALANEGSRIVIAQFDDRTGQTRIIMKAVAEGLDLTIFLKFCLMHHPAFYEG